MPGMGSVAKLDEEKGPSDPTVVRLAESGLKMMFGCEVMAGMGVRKEPELDVMGSTVSVRNVALDDRAPTSCGGAVVSGCDDVVCSCCDVSACWC